MLRNKSFIFIIFYIFIASNFLFSQEAGSSSEPITIIANYKEKIKEMGDIKEGIDALKEEYHLSLTKENRSESESLALLLYSNSIQQSLRYHNTLSELLSSKKIEEENIKLEIKNKEERIKQLENEIVNLNERKARIDYAKLIKEPTSSLSPVSPKKKLMVLIAGILGLFVFTMLAFFLDYLEKQRTQRQG